MENFHHFRCPSFCALGLGGQILMVVVLCSVLTMQSTVNADADFCGSMACFSYSIAYAEHQAQQQVHFKVFGITQAQLKSLDLLDCKSTMRYPLDHAVGLASLMGESITDR